MSHEAYRQCAKCGEHWAVEVRIGFQRQGPHRWMETDVNETDCPECGGHHIGCECGDCEEEGKEAA